MNTSYEQSVIVETIAVHKTYMRGTQRVDALRGVSLSIARGELVAIVGASGSGKSTFLQLLGGLDRPTSGSVRLAGEPIESYSEDRLSAFRRRRLGFADHARFPRRGSASISRI